MRNPLYAIAVLALVLSVATPARAALFSSGPDPDAEISATQYAALLGVREMAPKKFRDVLLPLIETAMQDGKLTHAELADLEKAAGSLGPEFLTAAKAPSLRESFSDAVDAAGKKSMDFGDKLNESLSENVPRLFDDALNLFRDKLNEQRTQPAAPANPGVTDL